MSTDNPNNNNGVLVDHEPEPNSSSASLFVPDVPTIPTLLDDLKTEEVTNSELSGFQTSAKLQNEEKEEKPPSAKNSSRQSSASSAKHGDARRIVDEPNITEILEFEGLTAAPQNTSRLVIVSWKIRQFSVLTKAAKSNVYIFQYKSDASLNSILTQAKDLLSGQKAVSLAFVGHGNPGTLFVSGSDKILNAKTVVEESDVKKFFHDLVKECIDQENPNCHLDFLASSLLLSGDGQFVIQTLQDYIRIPITASKDILGTDNVRQENDIRNTGELYFNPSLVRSWSGSVSQSISSYEKIRTLGRGAYGTAVLYRKKDDDSLVVLKEITILDLSAAERQAAMNEVRVLGMLSHPNIISYYDSFDEDGTLWIEMEYADGGTLSDYLAKQEIELEERDILIMFSQMVSAIKYCHDHNILHRDLKTQNIFLTQEFKVKLGDFGIAKVMNTTAGGNFSVVGTPYYISPEMCEGKKYNNKSDIWALGCVLYEMANLTRTFDGTNLPALINKIVNGTFAPIRETFSPEFRLLVRDLLQKEPVSRPSAEEILFTRLQELLQRYDQDGDDDVTKPLHYARTRSLLYFCDVTTMQLYPIQELPPKILVSEVAVGLGHIVVVSAEHGVYTWGDNSCGQLGHGGLEPRDQPTEVVLLRGKQITRAFCGNYFTLFFSDNGLVLSCGQGNHGNLGHGDLESLTRPKLIDDLIMMDIVSISTGFYHVAACTAEGVAYTWGRGNCGQLGHGGENSISTPTIVKFPGENIFIKSVHCSEYGTVFVTDTGNVFACGRNFQNKLGLNPRQGFLLQFRSRNSKNIVESISVPTLVKELCKYQLQDIKFGTSHSAIINDKSNVFTNGDNSVGQLGCGNTKQHETVTMVKGLEENHVSIIACGSSFSICGVQEIHGKYTTNSIYFWGTKPHSNAKRSVGNDPLSARSQRSRTVSGLDDDSSDPDASARQSASAQSRDSAFLEARSSHSDTSRSPSGREENRKKSGMSRKFVSSMSVPEESYSDSVFNNSGGYEIDNGRRLHLKSLLKGSHTQTLNLVPKDNTASVFPRQIFKFESVGCDDEEYPVVLQDIKCFQDHVIIHLETTAPPPKKKKVKKKKLDSSYSSAASTKEGSSENSEADTSGEAPTWLRNEVELGIPFGGNHTAGPNDSGNMGGPSDSAENTLTNTPIPNRKSFELSKRKSDSLKRRDPNFDLIPKIQRQVTMLKLNENNGTMSSTLLGAGTVAMTETQIIDGVAVSKSIAEIQNQLTSPHLSDQPTDEESINSNQNLKSTILEAASLPHTPMADVATSKIPKLKNKGTEVDTNIDVPQTKVKGRDGSMTQPSKTKTKRNPKTEGKSKSFSNARDKSKKDSEERNSSASDIDDTRDRSRVKNRRKDTDKSAIEEAQRLAKISEEKLLLEIEELRDEKAKREDALKEMHEKQLKEREELSRQQIEEAKMREDSLKDEIFSLKSDLNNQNSKLQDNYNILLSLQEQLLRMQQNQLRSSSSHSEKKMESSLSLPSERSEHKSKVCAVM